MHIFEDHLFALRLAFNQLIAGKYWGYLIPSLLIALVFGGILGFISLSFSVLSSVNSIPWLGTYLASGVDSTASFVDWTLTALYQFFILTVLSPVNAFLSEQVDSSNTNKEFKTGVARFISDVWRSMVIVIVSFLYYILVVLAWRIITKITGFHYLDEPIYFLIAAFFIGFSFYDYSLERYKIKTKQSWEFGFKNALTLLIAGSLFSVLFMISRIGVFFAPFIVTIVTTLVYLKMENRIPVSDTKQNTDA